MFDAKNDLLRLEQCVLREVDTINSALSYAKRKHFFNRDGYDVTACAQLADVNGHICDRRHKSYQNIFAQAYASGVDERDVHAWDLVHAREDELVQCALTQSHCEGSASAESIFHRHFNTVVDIHTTIHTVVHNPEELNSFDGNAYSAISGMVLCGGAAFSGAGLIGSIAAGVVGVCIGKWSIKKKRLRRAEAQYLPYIEKSRDKCAHLLLGSSPVDSTLEVYQ